MLSERAIFTYKCTEFYYPEHEHSLLWNDPNLDIKWPLENPFISKKDKDGLSFDELSRSNILT